MAQKHILILGAGSIGKRHAKNLSSLGCRISCFDPREDRINELADEVNVDIATTDIDAAFQIHAIDGVVIASPTVFHPEQTIRAFRAGLPVLLEKPVAKTLLEALDMSVSQEQTGVPILLGYTWRWWLPLRRVKELLRANAIGRLLHVQFHMSAHLADWHPWERYQDFFMASQQQGGGALLDESHWIDLMVWFFGMPESLYGQVETNSGLEIETDDNVDVMVNYADGKRVTLHLDLYGRPHEKFIRFVGEEGTILWSADPNRISVGKKYQQEWEIENFSCERNDMFMHVAEEYLQMLDGKTPATCNLQDGVNVMDIVEAIRKSNQEQKRIRISHNES